MVTRRPEPEPSYEGVYAFLVGGGAPGAAAPPVRLDSYLNLVFKGRSRHYWQRKIDDGVVTLGGRPARPASRVRTGDRIEVLLDGLGGGRDRDESPTFRWISGDADLLAVDKRAGAFCHPVGRLHRRSVVTDLEKEMGVPVHPVHRLDRFVSGLMVFARHAGAARAIGRQFEDRTVAKEYLALVCGEVQQERTSVEVPVGRATGSPIRMAMGIDPGGKPAVTDVEVVERLERHTVVVLRPHTGRRHQLRLHMATIGHPIAGDPIYGARPDVEYFERQGFDTHDDAADAHRWIGLHSFRLTLVHPGLGTTVTLEAPLSGPMREAIEALRG